MLRFLTTFCATLFVSGIIVTVLFPPTKTQTTGAEKSGQATLETPAVVSSPGRLVTIDLVDRFDLSIENASYSPPANISTLHQFEYPAGSKQPRVWHGFSPGGFGPFPALILLHGSNRTGDAMIDMWRKTARNQGIALIAPHAKNPAAWDMRQDGRAFLQTLLVDAQSKYKIDPEQIYVMGHSAGGLFVQRLAGIDNPPWKALASHGAATRQKSLKASKNPVPVYLYTGSKDHLFPPDQMKRAAEMLASNGHNVKRYNIIDHNHWYYKIGPQLAPLIWKDLTESGS